MGLQGPRCWASVCEPCTRRGDVQSARPLHSQFGCRRRERLRVLSHDARRMSAEACRERNQGADVAQLVLPSDLRSLVGSGECDLSSTAREASDSTCPRTRYAPRSAAGFMRPCRSRVGRPRRADSSTSTVRDRPASRHDDPCLLQSAATVAECEPHITEVESASAAAFAATTDLECRANIASPGHLASP